jgi:multidrug efflux pump
LPRDLKFDQPQASIADRDKLRSQGVEMSEAGRDLSTPSAPTTSTGSASRVQLQSDPQVMRADRLTPDQLERSTSPDRTTNRPLVDVREPEDDHRAADPKKFQQLNASASRADSASGAARSGAAGSSRTKRGLPQGFTIDYAGESRQLGTEGGKFLGTFLLSAILIISCFRRSSRATRDPFIIQPVRCRWPFPAP